MLAMHFDDAGQTRSAEACLVAGRYVAAFSFYHDRVLPDGENERTEDVFRMYLRRVLVLLGVLLLCASAAFGGEIQEEVFPLERNGIQLHLERYQPTGGELKGQLLLVHGLTYSSHEFDIDYKDYSFARFFARYGCSILRDTAVPARWRTGSCRTQIMRLRTSMRRFKSF
jgi:hypothetical protein